LDFLRAAGLLAARRFALAARVGGARQHAVFGGDPAAAGVLEERRHALLGARGAQHLGVAELDQHRALGVLGIAALDAHRAQLVGATAVGAAHCAPPSCQAIATAETLSQSAPAYCSARSASSGIASESGLESSACSIWRGVSGPQKPSEHSSTMSSCARRTPSCH